MITEINPALMTGLRPPAPAVAAANAAANRPTLEDIHALAGELRQGLLPAHPPAPASLPGLGGNLDLYDTVGKQAMGLYGGGRSVENLFKVLGEDFDPGRASFEPPRAPRDFPYLEPLAGRNLGNLLNTLT